MFNFSPSFLEGVFASLVAAFIWFLLAWLARQIAQIDLWSQLFTFQLSPLRKYAIVFAASCALSIPMLLVPAGTLPFANYIPSVVFFALGIAIYPIRWLYNLSKVGLFRVDPIIAEGINYDRALRLAKNSIDFLGTGAHKLTSSDEFNKAIERCNRSKRPLRFLLSDPTNPGLTAAASQANEAPDTYRHRVEQSLVKLADLHLKRHMNIEVRLYRSDGDDVSPESFRLMFIDDMVCLMSYNVYGRKEGREVPQIMFRNAHDADDTKFFYFCFYQHFEQKWKSSKPWDPKTFLKH